jgi:very-short-patch-repair endonuclease
LTELEYIIKQISKTNKKNYENYVVTRIWHGLNCLGIKFVTQQYVSRPNGYALTDMFFPQFDLHIEIDEPAHLSNEELDRKREIDVINSTNHRFERIAITDSISHINNQTDKIIEQIKSLKTENNNFEPWNLEKEFNPNFHREKGYLDINENPAFRTILDASNCLGQNYKGVQRAWFKSKVYENHNLWFPKFYENADWDNKMVEDGKTIIEKCKIEGRKDTHYYDLINSPIKRIVFPRSIDNLGFILYKFKGIFVTDKERSSPENGMVYKRIDTRFEMKK